MMTNQSQNSSKFFSLVLLILAVVFTGLTTAELMQISRTNDQASAITDGLLDQIKPDKKTAQRSLDQYQKAAEQLARNNSFILPVASEPPSDCTAIFGDEARFGNRLVKTGDTLGDAKVLDVGAVVVTLEWEGKILKRSPVLVADNSKNSSSRNRSSNKQQNSRGDKLRDVEAQIKAAVNAGELSRRDAELKLEYFNNSEKAGGYEAIESRYDGRGNLTEQTYNDGTRVLYNTAGNVTEKIGPGGEVWRARDRE